MKKHTSVLVIASVILLGCERKTLPEDAGEVFQAAEKGDVVRLKRYLERGGDPNLHLSQKGSLLISAIDSKNTQVLKMLIDAGADVNGKSSEESGPLLVAIVRGQCQQAKVLFSAGASLGERYVNYWRDAMPAELKDAPVSEVYLYRKRNFPSTWKEQEKCWTEWESLTGL